MTVLSRGIRIVSVGAGLVVLLAACAAPAAQTEPSRAPLTQSPGSSAPPTATPSATPSPAPTPTVYTGQQIETALTKVNASQGLSGQVVGQADLVKTLPAAEKVMQQLNVQPARCGAMLQIDFSKLVSQASIGTLLSRQPGSGASLTVSAMSFPSLDAVKQALAGMDPSALTGCTDLTLTIAGITVHGRARQVEASVPGAKTVGVATSVEVAGTSQTTLQIIAVKGSTEVSSILAMPGADSPQSIQKVEGLVSSTFAALEAPGAPA